MTTRPAAPRRPAAPPFSPTLSKPSSSPNSPRSTTPTHRLQAPRTRHQFPMVTPAEPNPPRPTNRTTTGRKRGGRKRRPANGEDTPGADAGSEQDNAGTGDDDHDQLFQLLGVPQLDESNSTTLGAPPNNANISPIHEKGILRLSKESMELAKGRTTNGKTKNNRKAASPVPHAFQDTAAGSESEPINGRSKLPPARANGASKRKGKGPKKTEDARTPDSSFDMEGLSRSLPPDAFAAKDAAGASQNQSSTPAWDTPNGSPPTAPGQLTWQQQLQVEETPSKSRKNGDRRRPKPQAIPNPVNVGAQGPVNNGRHHDRVRSLDRIPVSSLVPTYPVAPKVTNPSYPLSNFDSSIPYHTGFNVHRAPQTPMRNISRNNGSPPDSSGGSSNSIINLPVMGEFPRLNKAGGIPLGAPKYAGPTFHNSPHGSSLPKPDLDDF